MTLQTADRMANEGIDVSICSRRVVSSCAHETAGRTSSASGPVRTPLVAQPGSLVSPFYPCFVHSKIFRVQKLDVGPGETLWERSRDRPIAPT